MYGAERGGGGWVKTAHMVAPQQEYAPEKQPPHEHPEQPHHALEPDRYGMRVSVVLCNLVAMLDVIHFFNKMS